MKGERLWPANALRTAIAVEVMWVGAGIGGLIAGLAHSPVSIVPAITGAALLALALVMVIPGVVRFRPVRLTDTGLVNARSVRQGGFRPGRGIPPAREIPLAAISGVGMICQPGGQLGGWWLRIWVGDEGTEQSIGVFRAGISMSRDSRTGKRTSGSTADYIPPPGDGARLEGTKAGKAAKLIYERVLAAQGPDGLLATKQHQRDAPLSRFNTPSRTGVWGPDGTFRVAD